MIGILYESDEWSDWKLGRELESTLAENALAEAAPAEANSQAATRESGAVADSWHHVRMINMEDADAIKQALACDLLVSRVFASAAFRGHEQAHRAMEELIGLIGSNVPQPFSEPASEEIEGTPGILLAPSATAPLLINPGRAHRFEIDKRLATETLRTVGITAPAIIAWGTPADLGADPDDCDDSRAVASNREETREISNPRAPEAEIASRRVPQPTPDQWPYPCIIKPNCGGRTTHTAVLRNPADARAFLDAAPNLVFIVEPYIEAVGGFLTRIEVVDGRIALMVKRSVAASGLSSYHEGSTYELYPDCPAAVTNAVLEAARILDIQFGSFDVIEASGGNFIIDANSVSNVSEDCTELFDFDLMAAYAQALAARYRELKATQVPRDTEP